jgi:hypothetical protein
MATKALGKLQRVDLREVWDNEAGSFTPWLAQEDNIKLLGDCQDANGAGHDRVRGVRPDAGARGTGRD